jgi:hypothetical protein
MRMDNDHEVGQRLYSQFMAVSATREVTPDLDERLYLRWLLGGPQPPGLDELRDALDNDMNDAGERQASQ